jgi:hypothetical protein
VLPARSWHRSSTHVSISRNSTRSVLIGPLQTTCESTPWCTVDCAYGPCANQTDCEAAGACDDAELTNPLLYRNVTTGDPFDPMYRFPVFLRVCWCGSGQRR